MRNSIKQASQSERRAEQQADRKERQRELHTPTLKKVSRWQADALLSDLLDQAEAMMVAGGYVPNSRGEK